ncbi:UDP-N-acetylenolpyruvoylglucosamine reductase [Solitalea longa]|uniref:UDP-N-acetylenolpyruvoylglucosamine reductase n=1 Tax=Solitalea longa TaxID=2079460 RepID=A0A2S4ZZI9_9SPHI|nr:UDP-N-acetylmuramate dehydrogenase [Solitalea longa]POY35715.1 UDP-N-acetylenolpyruvoylglucosamine reductase [Solitalea longa]
MVIHHHHSLKRLNTFGVDAYANSFVEISHPDQLVNLFSNKDVVNQPLLFLGGGSNMLFTRDFNGLVIKMSIKGIQDRVEGDEVFVKAGAGVVWNDLVNYCVDNGYSGIENLSLIPGSVGASPIQNIGAYGVELKDVFYSLEAFEISSCTIKSFNKQECEFGYRESIFKGKAKGQYIVTSVTLQLSKTSNLNTSYGAIEAELVARGIENPTINDVSKVVSHIRVSKLPDPSTIGNAGSFFKNPIISSAEFETVKQKHADVVNYPTANGSVKLAAGYLIEQCGWKGMVVGNTGTWKNQALVLVNHGGASGQEIFDFSEVIIQSVKEKFGVSLEREVNIF